MFDPRKPTDRRPGATTDQPPGASGPEQVLALPFDQYQRYRLVADLVVELRARSGEHSILDVGGRTGLLRWFLPDDHVTLVDLEPPPAGEVVPGLVLGDGCRLPFGAGAFDVVSAFDTLEHVPPEHREAFVRECARVSRGWVFLAGPYRSPEVEEAEAILRAFLGDKLGIEHRYLEEHHTHGLPERRAVEERLLSLGADVTTFGHGNLDRWVALMCMEMYLDQDPILRPLAERFFRFYNEALYASDHAAPVYRHVVVAAHPGRALPTGEGILDFPRAPEGALREITDFAVELLAFDRERDVWGPERERLQAVIDALEEDLEGHRTKLAETERDLATHRETLDELGRTYDAALVEHAEEKGALEQDLAAHAASLAETKGIHEATLEEREREKSTFEDDLAQHAARIETLRADLVEHEGSIADLRRELGVALETQERTAAEAADERARFEDDVAQHDATIATLRADLVEHEASIADLGRELELALETHERTAAEAAAERASFEDDLAQHDATIATLRADLDEHRESVASQRREIEALRETQERTAAEAAEQGAAFEKDLEEHRATIAELERDVAEHAKSIEDWRTLMEKTEARHAASEAGHAAVEGELRRELAAQEEGRAALEGHLAETETSAAAIEDDLRAAREGIEEMNESVRQKDEELSRLRREARSRWQSLVRVFKKPRF